MFNSTAMEGLDSGFPAAAAYPGLDKVKKFQYAR